MGSSNKNKKKLLQCKIEERILRIRCVRRSWSRHETASRRLRSNSNYLLRLWVSGQRFVVLQIHIRVVPTQPTLTTKVTEAGQISAIIRSMLYTTTRAQRILQIWINLNTLRELGRLDFDEWRGHSSHVTFWIVEGDSAWTDGIFVFISAKK